MAMWKKEYEHARSLVEESRAINAELGGKVGIAHNLFTLGQIALGQQDYTSARQLFEQALEIERELGDKRMIPIVLKELGIACQLK
jgi:uncharacterized protein HemY